MAQLHQLTVHQLAEKLMQFIREHEGDPRLNQPVVVTQYEQWQPVYDIELVDTTDECDRCDDPRCPYGGPRYGEAPTEEGDLEAAGFVEEGLHWQVVIQYHEAY